MSINASYIPLIQDLKAEYPDVTENVIINIVHSFNGHMPSIRVALDSRRNQRLRNSHHLHPPKVAQPQFPRGRPNSFPSFNQPLTIDVNEERLPNHFQMEMYTEMGRRPPPPNYVNPVSLHSESDYIHQQRQRLAYVKSEIDVSKRHLNSIEADIRCREQLMNQREFGSDQTFPSVTHINMMKQEIIRKRLELRNHIPMDSFHESGYQHRQRTPGPMNSVSAPGTPDLPAYNMRLPGQRQLSVQPVGYSHISPQPLPFPPFPSPSLPPPVPPHRTPSLRCPPPPPQPFPYPPARVPPRTPPNVHRRSVDTTCTGGNGGHHSRTSSHRNSTDGVVLRPSLVLSEEQEGATWNCSKCTFLNHPAMRVCEMCDTPKVIPQGI